MSTHPDRASALAHPNLALIKYWGKRDDDLVLPHTGSLSLTLDVFPTRTTVALDPQLREDEFTLNGQMVGGAPAQRVRTFLELIRDLTRRHGGCTGASEGSILKARVTSQNSVPTGAGLASSASGFAALAAAAATVYGLPTDPVSLSRLARRGSGSACRSTLGGLVVWHPGEGEGEAADATSFAEQLPGPELAMVIAVVSAQEKSVSSRVAMKQSIRTSPFFPGWVSSTTADLAEMTAALAAGDYTRVGELTESNALRMHAVINGNRPPVRYLSPVSVALFDALAGLRAEGLEVYGTADAGPNVAVLCRAEDLEHTHEQLAQRFPQLQLIPARSGPGVRLVEEGCA